MNLTGTELDMITLLLSRANDTQLAHIQQQAIEMLGNRKPNAGAVTRPLRVGDRVIFTGRKTKPPVIGTIKSMNDKTYTIVNCSDNGPGWRIPPHALKLYTGA